MYRKIKEYAGLTLIELLIAAMLFSVIIASSAWLLLVGFKEWSSETDRINIRQEGMPAMETMVRYLGMASNITAASSTSVTFSADVDNNGSNETVTISYDAVNKKINRTISGTTATLTPYVSSFSFTYYQAGQVLFVPVTQADRDTIKIVTITITMSKGSDTITLSSSAFCRNQA